MATTIPRLVNLLPCSQCGGAHQERMRLEGIPVLECAQAPDNGLYLKWAKGRPYFVTGPEPERTRDGR